MAFLEMKEMIGDGSHYYNNEHLQYVFIKKKGGIYGKKVTSAKVASKASKALSDGRSSARTKSNAGSALSQREESGKRK